MQVFRWLGKKTKAVFSSKDKDDKQQGGGGKGSGGAWGGGGASSSFPANADLLQEEHLLEEGEYHLLDSGVPATADSFAYEPGQKLLAVGTSDGRVKLFGRLGVEKTLYTSVSKAWATRQLMFFATRGVLLRVTKGGVLEAWSLLDGSVSSGLDAVRALPPLKLDSHERVRCVASLDPEPVLAIGTSAGGVRFASLVVKEDKGGRGGGGGGRAAQGLKLLPHAVSPDQLLNQGEVLELDAHCMADVHRLLALHAGGGLSVWDVRCCSLSASLSQSQATYRRHGPAMCACWVGGSSAAQFASGHPQGNILVWSLPTLDASPAPPAAAATLLAVLSRVAPPLVGRALSPAPPGRSGGDGSGKRPEAAPVARLAPLCRGRGGLTSDSWLVVLGGGEVDGGSGGEEGEGEGDIALVSLRPAAEAMGLDSQDEEEEDEAAEPDGGQVVLLGSPDGPELPPALDFVLLPPPNTLSFNETPAAVLQLLEGGGVAIQPLGPLPASSAAAASTSVADPPRPFCPPLQRVAAAADRGGTVPLTRAELYTIPVERKLQHASGALSLAALRAMRLASHASASTSASSSVDSKLKGLKDKAKRRSGAGSAPAAVGEGQEGEYPTDFVAGGRPPKPDPEAAAGLLYCTGHKDGRVRLWDVYGEQPQLLAVAPSPPAAELLGGGKGKSKKSVTALELVWEQGVLVTGHLQGEVRLYQFSERASKDVGCVWLSEVGAEADYREARLSEPPGFQLKLVSAIHGHEVVALSYSPASKAVVVADKRGGVSLLDMAVPAVLWYAEQEPALCVQLGVCLVPQQKRSSVGAAELGGPTPAAFYATATGAVGVVSHARGKPLTRNGAPMQPKPNATPVCLELLDEHGAPTWLSRYQFTQASLTSQAGFGFGAAAAALASRRGQNGAADEEEHGGSDEDDGQEDEGNTWARKYTRVATKAKQRKREEEEEEEQREEGQGEEGDGGVGGYGRSAGGHRRRRKFEPGRQETNVRGKKVAGALNQAGELTGKAVLDAGAKTLGVVKGAGEATLGVVKGAGEAGVKVVKGAGEVGVKVVKNAGGEIVRAGGKTFETLEEGAKVVGGAVRRGLEELGVAGGEDEAGVDGGAGVALPKEPAAAYVLVAAESYLRVYRVGGVLAGEREPEAKVTLSQPLLYARAFHADGAPGLLVITYGDEGQGPVLRVYSLPSLGLLLQVAISDVLGWPWDCPRHAPRLCAATRLGHVALAAPSGEVALLGVAAGIPEQQACNRLYDWELAARQHAQMAAEQQGQGGAGEDAAAVQQQGRGTAAGTTAGTTAGGMLGALHGVARGLAAAVAALPSVFVLPQDDYDAVTRYNASHPELRVVLTSAAAPRPRQPPSRGGAGTSAAAAAASTGRRTPPAASVRQESSDEAEEDWEEVEEEEEEGQEEEQQQEEERVERSTGARDQRRAASDAPPSSAGRTNRASLPTTTTTTTLRYTAPAAEAPRQYKSPADTQGRPQASGGTAAVAGQAARAAAASAGVRQAQDIASATRNKLAERGEKIRRVDDKAGELEGTASDFASLARQLKEQQQRGGAAKWW